MSRLRRLQVTGKTFFITCKLRRVRTQLTELDFEGLASAVVRSRRARDALWQPRYFDRIVRNVGEYHKTMEYMHLNPVRRGLVSQPEDWLWSSIHSYGGPGPIRLPVDQLILPAEHRTPL